MKTLTNELYWHKTWVENLLNRRQLPSSNHSIDKQTKISLHKIQNAGDEAVNVTIRWSFYNQNIRHYLHYLRKASTQKKGRTFLGSVFVTL